MAVDRVSGDFGGKLREARERRGVSLRQIANATKIAVSVLEALERNDISRLPGGIFGRAFVRSYAVEVGLDPETTIQEFIAQFPNDSVTVGHPTSHQVEDHQAVESDRRMAGTFLWLILVSVPVAGAVLYFATAGRRDAPAEPQAAEVTTSAPESRTAVASPAPLSATPPEPATAAAPRVTPSPAPAPPATSSPPAAATPPPGAATAGDSLTVSMTAKSPCWVSATVDGQRVIERLMQPGERSTLEVKREIVLTAGDGAALAVTLNGAAAKPLGKAGEVVTAHFTLANFKNYVQAR
jgi:cytoskeleton protein RodZ